MIDFVLQLLVVCLNWRDSMFCMRVLFCANITSIKCATSIKKRYHWNCVHFNNLFCEALEQENNDYINVCINFHHFTRFTFCISVFFLSITIATTGYIFICCLKFRIKIILFSYVYIYTQSNPNLWAWFRRTTNVSHPLIKTKQIKFKDFCIFYQFHIVNRSEEDNIFFIFVLLLFYTTLIWPIFQ